MLSFGSGITGGLTKAAGGVLARTMKDVDIKMILNSAQRAYNNTFTEAGHALTKRQGPISGIPRTTGNDTKKNASGLKITEEILTNPNTSFKSKKAYSTGHGFDFRTPTGIGVRTNEFGNFTTLLGKSESK